MSNRSLFSRLFSSIVLIAIILLATSCGRSYIIDEEVVFENQTWSYDNVLSFDIPVTDTAQRYNIFLEIEHTTEYDFQNIYMNIYTKYPSGEEQKQPLNVGLAAADGKWKGKCNKEACTALIVLQQRAYFNQLGVHTLKFEQFTRTENLMEIKELSFKVEKAKG